MVFDLKRNHQAAVEVTDLDVREKQADQATQSIRHVLIAENLEENNPQQADEDSLGLTYDQIDDYLEGKAIDRAAQQVLEQRYRQTEHKRQGPVTLYCNWDL